MDIILFLLLLIGIGGCTTSKDKKVSHPAVTQNQPTITTKETIVNPEDKTSQTTSIEIIDKNKGGALDILVRGNWLFKVDYNNSSTPKGSLKVINLALEETPTIATIPIGDQPGKAYYQNGYIYNADFFSSGVHVIDVRIPEKPVYSGLLRERYAQNVSVYKNYAYIAAQEDGLRVIDLAATTPTSTKKYDGCPYAIDLDIKYPYLYLACSQNLQIIDISDFDKPFLAKELTFQSEISNIALNENRAYLPMTGGDLSIIDITDPRTPALVKTIYTGAEPAGAIDLDEHFAYIGNGAGLTILNKNTLSAKHLELGNSVTSVQIAGKYIYCLAYHTILKIKLNTINFDKLPDPPDFREHGDGED